MVTPEKLAEIRTKWRDWLLDNPEADECQQYYAAGVMDGLKYAATGEPFAPDWKETLKLLRE